MGSDQGHPNEQPIHTVIITRDFYVARYAVTFEEYDVFCQDTNSILPDDNGRGRGNRPVFHINSYEAMEYCNWLSEKVGLEPCYDIKAKATKCDFTANGYRLPTEAEWEYAASGGQNSKGYIYSGSDNPDEVGWYEENSGGQTHPVGQKKPNELNICDMSGNMWEWCWDWFDKTYYSSSPKDDPTGPTSIPKVPGVTDPERARRGGSYQENADSMRVTQRSADSSTYRGGGGFRLVRTA
jgi:formylglycine-generating enzyme required for sulfatase activity